MLAVVDDRHDAAGAQLADQFVDDVTGADRLESEPADESCRDAVTRTHLPEVDEPRSPVRCGAQPTGDLERQASLAGAADAKNSVHDARLFERVDHSIDVSIPPHEVAGDPGRLPATAGRARSSANSPPPTWKSRWAPSRPLSSKVPRSTTSRSGTSDRTVADTSTWPPWPALHHPSSKVQRGAEVVAVSQFGVAGVQPHPYRQCERLLGGNGSRDGQRLGEVNAAITPSPVCLNCTPPCAWITSARSGSCSRIAAAIGGLVVAPALRRALDVGEEERHDPGRPVGLCHTANLHLRRHPGSPDDVVNRIKA